MYCRINVAMPYIISLLILTNSSKFILLRTRYKIKVSRRNKEEPSSGYAGVSLSLAKPELNALGLYITVRV